MRAKAAAVLTICACVAFCASADKKTQKAREKDPNYQYNLGLFYLNQSNVDEAIKYFNKSLSLDPRLYQAWNMLGLAHASKGRLDESVKAYKKCLEINPQFSEVHNNLGTVYQEIGQLDNAEASFKAAGRAGWGSGRDHLSPGPPCSAGTRHPARGSIEKNTGL